MPRIYNTKWQLQLLKYLEFSGNEENGPLSKQPEQNEQRYIKKITFCICFVACYLVWLEQKFWH